MLARYAAAAGLPHNGFLTIRLLITWMTADSAIELEMTSPAR